MRDIVMKYGAFAPRRKRRPSKIETQLINDILEKQDNELTVDELRAELTRMRKECQHLRSLIDGDSKHDRCLCPHGHVDPEECKICGRDE